MTGMKHQRDFGGPGNNLFLDQTSSYTDVFILYTDH